MKRDMDLVRSILLRVEAAPGRLQDEPEIEGHDPDDIKGHIYLLKQAGFLEEPISRFERVSITHGYGLTWEGHEFLETIRDPKVWGDTKVAAGKLGSWSIGILAELAKGFVRQKAAELGLPLDPGA